MPEQIEVNGKMYDVVLTIPKCPGYEEIKFVQSEIGQRPAVKRYGAWVWQYPRITDKGGGAK
jgi:hypothetical protein